MACPAPVRWARDHVGNRHPPRDSLDSGAFAAVRGGLSTVLL